MGSVGPATNVTSTTTTFASAATVAAPDSRLLNRLVGYLEYGRALTYLDQLLNSIKPDELEVIEQMVRERDEFAIYSNLARRVERGPSTLSERATNPKDDFERRGLAWMMALARVELNAMTAGYTSTPKPFEFNRPSAYELEAYKEMLEDGVRSHYWAMQAEQPLATLSRGVPSERLWQFERQAIAYAHRAAVVHEMISALGRIRQGEYSRLQLAELDEWRRQLKDLEGTIAFGVLGLHNLTVLSTTKEEKRQVGGGLQLGEVSLWACRGLLEQAVADLRKGTATINGIPVTSEDLKAGRIPGNPPSASGVANSPARAGSFGYWNVQGGSGVAN